ncbi:ATP-binding protein [Nocardioides rubriscoriae]|uniref:ATP-binding protein n=1 Tax=Nocardioides rubriscoriae TaxID=642762 RepID=UPI0014785741|nr:ATP-binding protein [Nocardioides rubriscoriae]
MTALGRDGVFACDGEMARRAREFDWATTPLGPVETWSASLRTAVAIVLRTRYPMILSWGPSFVMIYNDAFIPTLGRKHPGALGGLLTHEFAEIWDDVGPLQRAVLAGGSATWEEDLPLPIERGHGPEETFFTFSYSHVPDDDGPGGVLAVLSVTTEKVVGARRIALLNALASQATAIGSVDQATAALDAVLAGASTELVGAALLLTLDDGPTLVMGFDDTGEAVDRPDADSVRASPRLLATRALASGEQEVDVIDVPGRGRATRVACPVRDGDKVVGVLVVDPHPLRPVDDEHLRFLDLLAGTAGQLLALGHARQEETERLAALDRLDAARTAFLSTVSHELRTPLTLVLGPLEDVVNGRRDALDPDEVLDMYRSAERLLGLVEALLDISRANTVGLAAQWRPTDVRAITAEVLRPFRLAADRAGLTLVTALQADIEVVELDADLWEKILINLVANALKFTEAGQVTVSLSTAPDPSAGSSLVLQVQDTGPGIPPEDQSAVFDRFHRIQTPGARSIEGSGLGLAVALESARALGGELTVHSVPGEGSTFTAVVPLLASTQDARPRAATRRAASMAESLVPLSASAFVPDDVTEPDVAEAPTDGSRPVVLVVDDHAALRHRVARTLSPLGTILTAEDGQAAWELLDGGRHVDLVVTDVMMPRLDGHELVRRVRADPRLRSLPVVVLSARAGSEAASEAMSLLADDYVVKPFGSEELLVRCRTALELAGLRTQEAGRHARTLILAGVSHDMQTPLAIVGAALELASDPEIPEETRRDLLVRAEPRVAHLRRLVLRFLDWSRLSVDEGLPIAVSVVDLAPLLGAVAAGRPGVTLTLPSTRAWARCDELRTEAALHNLVDNACRAATHVAIEVDTTGSEMVVRVRDDGPGIDAAVAASLFDPFTGIGRPGSHGLGLYVSREAARAQGGDLVLEETSATGTTFALHLPAARLEEP